MTAKNNNTNATPRKWRAAVVVAFSVATAFLARVFVNHRKTLPQAAQAAAPKPSARRRKVTAKSIAENLYAAGLEGEELFEAMWDWHDRTGIETRDMYTHYQALNQPAHTPQHDD